MTKPLKQPVSMNGSNQTSQRAMRGPPAPGKAAEYTRTGKTGQGQASSFSRRPRGGADGLGSPAPPRGRRLNVRINRDRPANSPQSPVHHSGTPADRAFPHRYSSGST